MKTLPMCQRHMIQNYQLKFPTVKFPTYFYTVPEVGVYINADGDVTKYSWEYNVETNKETPLNIAAKELYP